MQEPHCLEESPPWVRVPGTVSNHGQHHALCWRVGDVAVSHEPVGATLAQQVHPALAKPVLQVADLSVRYRQMQQGFWHRLPALWGRPPTAPENPVVDAISFDLLPGATLAIVGETGSGKSTLAKLLVGIEKPDSGEILLEGQAVTISDYKKYNHVIRYIFQDPARSLNPHQKVGQMLDDVLRYSTQLNEEQRQDKIHQTLQQLGLMEEHADYYPHMFSGGQRQRIGGGRGRCGR